MATIYHDYLKKVHATYMTGDATEPSYYSLLKELLENFGKEAGKVAGITVQPKKTKAGIPDFLLKTKTGKIIGYIEAKDPMIDSLIDEAQTEQLQRYRESLPNLILTNFLEFYLFREGKIINEVRLANPVFLKLGKRPVPENIDRFDELLGQFFSFSSPQTYTAKALATELAKRTRLLSSLILEELSEETEIISGIYKAFREELIESLTEESFADMYAQTISYGLFSARIQAKEEEFSGSTAYKYIPSTIPLLRHLFYLLTGPNLPESLEWIRDDIADVLASTDLSSIIKEFHTRVWTDDPVLHFYETFLAIYNPRERERCGVYYTPEPVVSYIIRSIHHILKNEFHKSDGLADKSVTLLDPAAGTLSFPSMAIRLAKEELEGKGKGGIFPGIAKEHILPHFYAFELMVAPYAIGHFKAATVLEDLGYSLGSNERFQFYLTNSLEMKEVKQIELIPDLTKEGQKAKEIKEKIPILVVCANPPYSVSSENKSEFIENLMDDYKREVRDERNIQPLSDDYIKFIRFAQWKIEQAGKGVIGYITNNSYLSGIIHRGMRHNLLQAFDKIYVLNLHGSSRIGERAPDGGKDENVFDIQQGVWASVNLHSQNSARGLSALASSGGLGHTDGIGTISYMTPEQDLAGRITETQDKYKDILKEIPKVDNQVGLCLLTMSGLESMESFNHPESWEAIRKAILGSDVSSIADISDQDGLFEFREDKAKSIVRELLEKEYDEKVAVEKDGTSTYILDEEKFMGEVVTLHDRPIHCAFLKKAS